MSRDNPELDTGETTGVPRVDSGAVGQIISTITQAAAAFLPLYNQQQLLRVQLERARAGKPPLDTSAYESATQGINVGVNRSTQNTLLWLAGGLAGVYLISKLLKR